MTPTTSLRVEVRAVVGPRPVYNRTAREAEGASVGFSIRWYLGSLGSLSLTPPGQTSELVLEALS
jgi:hypothetical protein